MPFIKMYFLFHHNLLFVFYEGNSYIIATSAAVVGIALIPGTFLGNDF